MCHKTQKFPAFEAGDELFRKFFAWCSSIGSHMSQQTNADMQFFRLFGHSCLLPYSFTENIIA